MSGSAQSVWYESSVLSIRRCARAKRDEILCPEIARAWQANMQVYGADKISKQMNRERITVARCTGLMEPLGYIPPAEAEANYFVD
jgi:hypothetical protein